MRRRAQSAIEYIIVVAFALLLITPLSIYAYQQLSFHQQELRGRQFDVIGNTIVNAAQEVYFQGEPAKLTVSIIIPDTVQNIIVTEYELVFFYSAAGGTDTVTVESPVSLQGTLPIKQGKYRIEIEAEGDSVSIRQV